MILDHTQNRHLLNGLIKRESKIYDAMRTIEKNQDSWWGNYDPSYIYESNPKPKLENFSSREEYNAAVDDWQENTDKLVQDESDAEYSNYLPRCF